jgi:urea transport system substrate-binding protein
LRSIRCMTLALLVCGAGFSASTAADAAESIRIGAVAEPIRIGAVLPFSGGVELYGQQAKLGLDFAVKGINAAGGILGRPVEVIYADDKTAPESAATAMHALIERDGVVAVVGPITSRNLNAIAPLAESAKTPLLYATNYEGGKCSRYVFSFGTVPNQELGQLLPYMNQTFGNSYFLLGADRVWPHRMFDIAQPIIEKLGGKVVGTQFTLGNETDFTALIEQVAASKAKVLLFALKGDGMDFIRQADDKGLLKDTTVAFLGLSEVDVGIFHGKGQNMYAVVPSVATSDEPSVKAFVARVRAEAGAEVAVSNYVMTHYNTLIALKAAIEKAATSTRRPSSTRWRGWSFRRRQGL